jgi:hypothetical protein
VTFDKAHARSPLGLLTLAYLALPNLIFFVGWLKPALALLPLLSIALAFRFEFSKSQITIRAFRPDSRSLRPLIVSGLLALVWVAFSGAGGFGTANFDWAKHFSVLRDLIAEPWPVVYQDPATADVYRGKPLVYYVGYYLPAAALGKLFGWTAANVALALWTWLGTWLTFTWLNRLVRPTSFALLIGLFVFFSGLDVVGNWLNGIVTKPGDHIEWWTDWLFQYPSMTSQLFWAPQHTLPAWLGTALLLEGLVSEHQDRFTGGTRLSYHWAPLLCLVWSPLCVLGFVPLWALSAWRERRDFVRPWPVLMFGLMAVLIFACFYQANHSQFPMEVNKLLTHPKGGPYYLQFVVLDLLVLCLVPLIVSDQQPWPQVLWCAFGCLLLVPLYRIGQNNDFAMRSSAPLLFCLFVCWARALPLGWQRREAVVLVAAATYVLGAVTPLNELIRGSRAPGFHAPSFEQVPSIPRVNAEEKYIAAQYIGELDTVFFKYLAPARPRSTN